MKGGIYLFNNGHQSSLVKVKQFILTKSELDTTGCKHLRNYFDLFLKIYRNVSFYINDGPLAGFIGKKRVTFFFFFFFCKLQQKFNTYIKN